MASYFDKVPQLRRRFREKFEEKINQNAYDPADLERFEGNDVFTELYLHGDKGKIEASANSVDISFSWRKQLGINGLTAASFPLEAHEKGALYYHNEDKDGHKILYFKVKEHKKDPAKLPILQKYIGWLLEQYFIRNMGKRIVVLFDMTDAGLSNMDLELIKFIITCFTTYYPHYLAYLLVYDMHWALNAVWKIIKAWLSEESAKYVIFVKKADVQEYINRDQLWEHMGGTDNFKYTYVPQAFPEAGDATENGILPVDSSKKRVTFAEREQNMYTSFSAEVDEIDSSPTSPVNSKTEFLPQKPQSLLTHRRSKEDNTFEGKYITVSPANQFEFEVVDEKKETLDILTLINVLPVSRVAFKVKTTSPEKYRVRPSTGVIRSGSSTEVSVYLQPGVTNVSRDKFLIMAMEIGQDGFSSSGELAEKWRTEPRESIMEYRLRCSLTPKLQTPTENEVVETVVLPKKQTAALEQRISSLTQKLDDVLAVQVRMEDRMDRIYRFQILFAVFAAFIAVVVALSYKMDYLPIQKYNVNTCLSHIPY